MRLCPYCGYESIDTAPNCQSCQAKLPQRSNPHLYNIASIFCIVHALLTSLYPWLWRVGIYPIIPLFLISLLAWWVWPFVIWNSGARKWRFTLPLLTGFVLQIPAFLYVLILNGFANMH
jgi:hypothetical protein